eukprot:SAG25_NODE_547_length_7025_cov_3.655357_4_plen_567_part_00
MGCLRAIHDCLCASIDPAIQALSQSQHAMSQLDGTLSTSQITPEMLKLEEDVAATINRLKNVQALRQKDINGNTPAMLAAYNSGEVDEERDWVLSHNWREQLDCVSFLNEIGSSGHLISAVRADPSLLTLPAPLSEDCWERPKGHGDYAGLLARPGMIDIQTRQLWLCHELGKLVGSSDAQALSIVVNRREGVLDGLCAQLGVDESTGQVRAQPRSIDVRYQGESASGDGLRREWFGQTFAEILDPARGLFLTKDGRTLQPNPHSAIACGPDHLAYFALLGRLTGLALFHREPVNAHLSSAFLKSVFGYTLKPEDLETVDPDLYETRIVYLRDGIYASRDGMELAGLDLVFEDDSNDAQYTEGHGRGSVDLKPGGATIAVTESNKIEYLQLFTEHRLLTSIQKQVDAVREGLAVFLSENLRFRLCGCSTVCEIQLMICGVPEIDVNDWETCTTYAGGLTQDSPIVRWFWLIVRAMDPSQRSQLLHFCTGSARVPASGFANLMGYSGVQQPFRLEHLADADSNRLPTASTCFNTLKLPQYGSDAELKEKLCTALTYSRGFDEGAVAV